MNTFNLLNIYFYKITELRKFCNEFNLATNGTKTNIISRILKYYLINTHNRKLKLCNDMRCKTCFYNSFLSNDKSICWDYIRNNLHPRYVSKGCLKKFLFNCYKCKHTFSSTLNGITHSNRWCCYCSHTILCQNENCKFCFNNSFASNPKAIYWSNKNIKKPREIFKSANKPKYLFNCNKCNHEFSISVNGITQRNEWCCYCSNTILCKNNDCKICFNDSFASHEKSVYWNSKNIGKPRDYRKKTEKKFLFNCDKCNHVFSMKLSDITYRKCWCNYCSNTILCKDNNCNICFNKSFASNPKSIYWNNKNIGKPRDYFRCNKDDFLFNCDKCKHVFSISLKSITGNNAWCSYCANQKLCKEDCDMCFKNSFASHYRSIYWSNKNVGKPRDYFKSNGKSIFIFNCNECSNEFTTSLNNITHGDTWCPICIHKTEKLFYNYFVENNINFIKEYTIENGKYKNSKKNFRYDFYLPVFNIIIEIDGMQHFLDIKSWKNNAKLNQYKDCYKMKFAINNINNVKIIRISQEDVYKNKINYKELLQTLLNTNNVLQQITYISADTNLYDNHTQYMNLNITELYKLICET